MAKKSMIIKANRPQKYKVREYTRCSRCGRPHAVMGRGILRVLTVRPDSPRAASGGFPGAGSHKSRYSPLLDMGFALAWQSPTSSPQRTTVGVQKGEN